MGRFDRWATRTPNPQPTARPETTPAPTPGPGTVLVPQGAVVYREQVPPVQPGERLVATHRPALIRHPGQVVPPRTSATPPPPSCVIMRGGGADRYAELLQQIPALNVPDLSGGVDAMALPGRPPGAPMERWTDRTRYYTGVTDQDSKETFEAAVQRRHRESVGAIRATSAQVTRGQNHL